MKCLVFTFVQSKQKCNFNSNFVTWHMTHITMIIILCMFSMLKRFGLTGWWIDKIIQLIKPNALKMWIFTQRTYIANDLTLNLITKFKIRKKEMIPKTKTNVAIFSRIWRWTVNGEQTNASAWWFNYTSKQTNQINSNNINSWTLRYMYNVNRWIHTNHQYIDISRIKRLGIESNIQRNEKHTKNVILR